MSLMSMLYTVACIIQGEVGVMPEVGPRVARVIWTREAMGKGFDGWNGWQEPEPWAIQDAWEAWLEGADIDGERHAISLQDLAVLGFENSDCWECVYSDDRRWGTCFSREWR